MSEFHKRLAEWSEDIKIEFDRASDKGGKSPQEVSDFRESKIKDFVSSFFPFPYRVVKGVVRDSFDNVSSSIDVVLLNPVHPYTNHNKDKAEIILVDGVELAIEVKSDPTSKKEIQSFLTQSKKAKNLRRAQANILNVGKSKNPEEFQRREENAKKMPYFVFFMKDIGDYKDKALACLLEELKTVDPQECPDYIVVHGNFILSNEKISGKRQWRYEEWGEHTLAGFLLYLNNIDPPTPRMCSPIMNSYIELILNDIKYLSIDLQSGGMTYWWEQSMHK